MNPVDLSITLLGAVVGNGEEIRTSPSQLSSPVDRLLKYSCLLHPKSKMSRGSLAI